MRGFDRNRAAALLLLFAICAAVVAAILVPTVLSWRAHGEAIRLARLEQTQVLEEKRAVRLVAEAGDAWNAFLNDDMSGFVRAQGSDAAIEAIRAHLRGAIARHGGSITGLEARIAPGAQTRERIEVLGVELAARLPKDQLVAALYEIESEPPYVLVERFSVSGTDEALVSLSLSGRLYRFRREE